MSERQIGTIKWYNSHKRFGLIEGDGGGMDIFVHHSAIERDGDKKLIEGERVEFIVMPSQKGLVAAKVRLLPRLRRVTFDEILCRILLTDITDGILGG